MSYTNKIHILYNDEFTENLMKNNQNGKFREL